MSKIKLIEWGIALFLCSNIILWAESTQILCVDVGASRIKSAILHPDIDLASLQQIKPNITSSLGQLNKDFPLLFADAAHVFGWSKESFNVISLGITGPIKEGHYYLHPRTGIPYDLKTHLESASTLPVFLDNDSVIWARGALFWSDLTSTPVPLPAVAITLGTGFGIALVYSQDEIYNISLSHYKFSFPHLREVVSNEYFSVQGEMQSPSSMLGNCFFKNRSMLFSEASLKALYQNRKEALIKDLNKFFDHHFSITPAIYCFGGGHSRFLDPKEGELTLNPSVLESYGVDSDIISLLGCLLLPYKQPATILP